MTCLTPDELVIMTCLVVLELVAVCLVVVELVAAGLAPVEGITACFGPEELVTGLCVVLLLVMTGLRVVAV